MRYALVVMLAVAIQARGDQAAKRPVHVAHTGEDSVGIELAYKVREAVNTSSLYRLVDLEDAAYVIGLLSLSIQDDRNISSAISANYLRRRLVSNGTVFIEFLDSTVHIVGRDKPSAVAPRIVASLDRAIRQ